MNKKQKKLLVFTKEPILGEVKTRLQPIYSKEQSLKLHKKLIADTLNSVCLSDEFDVELCCAPNRNSLFFLNCENTFPITLTDQQGADLGERMAFAMSVALQTFEKVIIIGTDCPDINQEYIDSAVLALDDVDAVIGPASDGGYVLLGLKKFSLELFTDISWSSDKVFEQTLNVLNDLSWSYQELGIMHDLDRPEDLHRYKDLITEIS